MLKRPLMMTCLIFLLIRTLLLLSGIWAADLAQSPLERYGQEKQSILVIGEIVRIEEKEAYDYLYLKNNSITLGQRSIQEPAILVSLDKEKFQTKQLHIGNEMKVTGSLAFFDEPKNPGQFDQKFYYQKQKIHGQVWVKEMEVKNLKQRWMSQKLAQMRKCWRELLIGQLGEEHGSIMAAILLGEKSGLELELKTLYQKNGIGHILAISGVKTLCLVSPITAVSGLKWEFVRVHIAKKYIQNLCFKGHNQFPCHPRFRGG